MAKKMLPMDRPCRHHDGVEYIKVCAELALAHPACRPRSGRGALPMRDEEVENVSLPDGEQGTPLACGLRRPRLMRADAKGCHRRPTGH